MIPLSFQTTFSATSQILLMGGCGYFLMRQKIIQEEGLQMFSGLVVNFFLPCFILNQFLKNFDFALYPHWWIFPLISFGVTLSGFAVGQAMIHFFSEITFKKEFVSLVSFQNSGYLPLILVTTIFPAQQAQTLYVYICLFLIGFDLVLWSLGVWSLTSRKAKRFELKNIIHSPVVTIFIALALVSLGVQKWIPDLVLKPLKLFGDCTLPLSMLVVGGNLAGLKFSQMDFREIGFFLMAKLVILPLFALILVTALHLDPLIGFLIVLEAAVPSADSLSVIAKHYKIEERFINQGLVISHLASIITIPIFLMLYANKG